ncbi:flagellar hook-basal body complex protein [Sulfurospirillum diekertiae]|uniref:Flagellar hook protein FlgE n=1 Tax=Sulfurospirillum diekertiae TaxID=1854492 RepID=A0A1Y0HPV9_9BACT|nr:flagellar hook-basal body complex protein [Sulfurospirillum diekertiae]ARU50131.1 Flagellar hook protein FlgE [Sulfurospirillum diekertiae]ASC94919.1 Flagellar hook protein FlgE [Sulfurospirillum diekertiae]
MTSSFYNGISGIKSQQFAMDVQANNIANINTSAYKGSSAEISTLFSTVLTGTYASYSNDKGLGAQSQTTALNLAQGVLENTDSPFDLAIQGDGWFGVKGQEVTKTYYTRAGSFSLDAQGSLVNADGYYLMATPGNNIAPTSLDAATLAKFGTYYNAATTTAVTPYAITPMSDVPLESVGSQTKVTLPDILYYPPVATTKVSYGANLDPTIKTDKVTVPLSAADYTATVTPSAVGQVSLSGSVSNTTALQSPQKGDTVTITLTDVNGNTKKISTELDASLNWSISNSDVSGLNTTSALTANVSVTSNQETANTAHYTTGIIAPDGSKGIIDMTFTKQVPQAASGSTWDANIKVLSYFEDYTVENYDSTKTYDTSVYNVDTVKGTVTKIYDPTKYYVDTSTNKVYNIVDTQTGTLTFGGAGQLLSNSVPALSNGGTPLELNLGTVGNFDGLISSTTIKKANVSTSNGSAEGFLKDYAMDTNGNVIAEFSNGKSSAVAKVAIYHFQNDQGLTQDSSTLFEASNNSGKPIFYTDKNGESFLGSTIFSNKLEGSNVSMATALTELLITQKAFDASSKSITTSDDLIKNAINMKS